MTSGDRAKVTLYVAVPPAVAFEVFTRQIDLWWRRGPKFRHSGRHAGKLTFEERAGGRLFETYAVDGNEQLVEIGRVTTWEPPARVAFDWRNATFAPRENTHVEVRFDAAGEGTNVSVEHTGWSTLPAGHPARHGLEGAAFSASLGMWWNDVLAAFRDHARGGAT
jgi:uncharacterized protein YndB with AHSA1/START domain